MNKPLKFSVPTERILTNQEKINLILDDLAQWVNGGDSDCSMVFAYNNGFELHAASLWMSTGAMSEDVERKTRGVKISRKAEEAEVKRLLKMAHIYICPDCNHHAFLDSDEGDSIQCSSCLKIAKREVRHD